MQRNLVLLSFYRNMSRAGRIQEDLLVEMEYDIYNYVFIRVEWNEESLIHRCLRINLLYLQMEQVHHVATPGSHQTPNTLKITKWTFIL